MPLTFLIGGARSGKTRLAIRLAESATKPVVFLATGEARDAEMAERIRRHRVERPSEWTTVEEALKLRHALLAIGDKQTVVIDCLSLWIANLLESDAGVEAILTDAEVTASVAAARSGTTIAVTNEVGLGIVPATPLGREYRDLLGQVNASWAAAAKAAYLVVAGRTLSLEPPPEHA